MNLKPTKDKKLPRLPTAAERRKIAKERFLQSRKVEGGYQRQLTGVGRQIGSLIKGFAPDGKIKNLPGLIEALEKYADLIGPWARAVTQVMHQRVERRDAGSWGELGKEIGRALRKEIIYAPTGQAMRNALEYQVKLITSLPLEAAQRVHKLTTEAIVTGVRAEEIQKEIMRSGEVTVGRAKTIARTEVSRTASLLVESRAKHIGGTHYIWHTAEDSDVRPTHRKLNKRVFAWDNPPVTEVTGQRAHPGQIWNCRCWAEPIIPDEIK